MEAYAKKSPHASYASFWRFTILAPSEWLPALQIPMEMNLLLEISREQATDRRL
jgi:hypothetical protein